MARVGYLEFGSAAPGSPHLEAFRRGLRELGWHEGQNIALDVRYAEGKQDRLPAFAADLVRLKVDLTFASATPAALAAKQATTTIPVVIGFVADPVGSGLVPRLSRPGGNITGWTHLAGLELNAKRLEIHGVGYQVKLEKGAVSLTVGFSTPVNLTIPKGITVEAPNPTTLDVKGIDRQMVGQFSARIRSVRPPEPYKGKGIRFAGEQIRRKAGKSMATGAK